MARSLRLVEHRLEAGALLSFSEGPRVIFVRAGRCASWAPIRTR